MASTSSASTFRTDSGYYRGHMSSHCQARAPETGRKGTKLNIVGTRTADEAPKRCFGVNTDFSVSCYLFPSRRLQHEIPSCDLRKRLISTYYLALLVKMLLRCRPLQ